jgi:flagellar assembly protein FliH
MTTAHIVKAHAARELPTQGAFNFVDLRQEADTVVRSARSEANELLSQASIRAELIREQIRREACAEGLREARSEIERRAQELALKHIDAQLETALPALRSAAEALQAERDCWLIRWEETAIRVGIAIAEKLLKSRISTRPELASGMITEALRLAAGQPRVTVFLHPDDLASWGDRAPRIVESLTACADSILISDPQLARGGCRIQTVHGEIDARVETMLERLAEELLEG